MPGRLLYLSSKDLAALDFTMSECIDITEETLRQHALGKVELPPKAGLHPTPKSFLHGMAAQVSEMQAMGMKWISYYPENQKRGLEASSGILILNDTDSGLPLAIMEGMWITYARTAALSAVAVKHLAKANSRTVAFIGAGGLASWTLPALKEVLPDMDTVKVFDPREVARKTFCDEMKKKVACNFVSVNNCQEALEDADVIVSTTPQPAEPVLLGEWWSRGSTAVALDMIAAWDNNALSSADKLLADDWSYFENWIPQKRPDLALPNFYGELGDVVGGKKPGRVDQDERIMLLSCGLGSTDVTVAKHIYQLAKKRDGGQWLDL